MDTNATNNSNENLAGDFVIYQPSEYNEVTVISDYLKNNQSVIVNLELVSDETATYLVHFLSGVIYGIDGDIHNLGVKTYLCTPSSISVAGFGQ